jgi:hypothetical protein
VALVKTDVSEERIASIVRVTRIGEVGTKTYVLQLLVTANVPSSPILVTLLMEALSSSETAVLTRAIRRNIPEDGILRSHLRENRKSYLLIEWFHLLGYSALYSACEPTFQTNVITSILRVENQQNKNPPCSRRLAKFSL